LKERPIGVFDSGIGGLTVLQELARRMPRENLVYFGDTAHVPYGSKSRETVTRYSLAAARFLAAQRIKALVVACNTASALALKAVADSLQVPVLGVIEPGARAAAAATHSGRVGIIGTEATIASGAYAAALGRISPGLRILGAACPLFVPLAEEGWWKDRATLLIARRYLAGLKSSGIDTLVLGCTHYPFLKGVVRRVMGPGVRLIDSAQETAREAERLLLERGLLRQKGRGRISFFVSDDPERFLKLARRLIGRRIGRVRRHALD
jgi:glutamate racemase